MKLKPVTMRVPEDRLARIDERAKASGLTRTQYLLDRGDPEGAVKRATKPQDMTAPKVACSHPRAERKAFIWGTMCGLCRERIG